MNLKVTSLNSNDGLPVEQIHNLDMDFSGKLWLATSSGLACYNGANIKLYDSRTGIKCVGLRTVSVLFNDEIWIGTDQGVEVLHLNGQKKAVKFDFEWKYGVAECLVILNGFIFIGTSDGLLKIAKKGESYQLVHHYMVGFVRDLVQYDEDDILAVTGNQGLLRITGENEQIFCNTLPIGDAVICIKKSLDNYFLVGTTEGLFLLSHYGALIHKPSNKEYFKKVNQITISGADWWLSYGNELILVRLTPNGINIEESIFLESTINDILVDNYNNIWCATNNSGLKKITCLRTAIEYVDYGKSGSTYSIKQIDNSDAYVVTGDGLTSIVEHQPFQKKTYVQPIFKLPTIVWDSCIDPLNSSKIWLATQDGLYISESSKEPYKFDDKKNLINAPNRVLQVIGNSIWLGTISGLYCIINNEVEEVLNDENERFGYVYTFASSNENELWIGTLGQGLWLKTNSEIKHFTNNILYRGSNIYCIAINEKNQVVVLQEESLILIDETHDAERIIQEHPIAGWSVCWISDNEIAIGSNRGIILVNLATKKVTSRINLHLNKSDWQFTCSKSLSLYKDKYLLCSINAGLYVVDLDEIKKFVVLPDIYLSDITWQNVLPEQKVNTYVVPTGKWSVNISVYMPWYIDESQIEYRFKLVGFDERWSEPANFNSIKYNSLPPGEYTLQVQSYTPLTGFSEIKPMMNFEVTSPWWSSAIMPVIDSGKSFYNRFFKSPITNKNLIEKNIDLQSEIDNRKIVQVELTKKQEQLEDVLENYKQTEEDLQVSNTNLRQLSSRLQKLIEDEKKSIAREVHDVLGQRLTSLKWDTSWLSTKLKDKEPEYGKKAGEMIENIDGTINIVRKIASELRPSVLDDLGLEAAIEWHAKAFEKLTDIECQLVCEELSEAYSDDIKTAVFRIFQESLTNIIRHAKASKVKVKLYEENRNTIILEIEDNGLGISDERKNNTTSLGLLGMKERVGILDGIFLIRKLPIQGTLVKIAIPF